MLDVELIGFSDPLHLLFARRFEDPRAWTDERRADEYKNLPPETLEFMDFTFYISGSFALAVQLAKLKATGFVQRTSDFAFSIPPDIESRQDHAAIYVDTMSHVFFNIRQLIADGVKADVARTLFPLNVETNIVLKITLADLTATAHRGSTEYVECIGGMCAEVVKQFPQFREYLR